jgi:hypothetical protein
MANAGTAKRTTVEQWTTEGNPGSDKGIYQDHHRNNNP